MVEHTSSETTVIRTISPQDEMWPNNESEDEYFDVGRSGLDCILLALKAANKPVTEIERILDLPCGHGRVLRHLRAEFPEAEMTACDLLEDGVDFCAQTFDAKPVYSHEDPAQAPVQRGYYDLVWVGSLLTHLDKHRWPGFLKLFQDCLRPGGVMVFSTAGREVYRNYALGLCDVPYHKNVAFLGSYERTGFAYVGYHTNPESYGTTLSSPEFVLQELMKLPGLRVVSISERAWANRQDVFACRREDDWKVHHKMFSDSEWSQHRREEKRKDSRERRKRTVARVKDVLRPVKRMIWDDRRGT